MENKLKIMLSFLIGGTIGGAVALLFAPKPGRELRTDISQKTKELIEDGKNSSEQIWNGTKEKVGTLMDGANEVLNKAKHIIVDEAKRVKTAVTAGVKTYSEEVNMGEVENKSSVSE